MKSKLIVATLVTSILAIMVFSGIDQVSTYNPITFGQNTGPYVDKVVYKTIYGEDQTVLALQADTIELHHGFLEPQYYAILDADPDLNIVDDSLRSGYGQLTINCRDYPLNITALRRAFAFAFDKTQVRSDIFDGFSRLQDSVVPYTNNLFCIEDELPYHYYNAEVVIGNQLLDDAGFAIDPTSGFRLAPNGSAFDITIEYPASSPAIAGGVAQIGVDALRAMDINAQTYPADFNEIISRLDGHGDYDIAFYGRNFNDNDVEWLGYDYWSALSDTPNYNPSNFENATYDSFRDQLLYGVTYSDVYIAAAEMQMILQYNVPILVAYENMYLQAYRNDEFTGHVVHLGKGVEGQWTNRKIHKLDETPGGTVSVGIRGNPDSFNFFVSTSAYSAAIFENFWPSLFKHGPDLNPVEDLAESVLMETHADNLDVPDGHTRFTIDVIQNATWSDGIPVTAEDVAYTFVYIYESGLLGNPASLELGDLAAVYAPTTYMAVIEFDTESYWHFSSFAYTYIIPKHIFEAIGYDGWNTWNPVFNPADPFVNCGPFVLTDFEAGEFYELSKNPLFHYTPEITTTTTTIPTTTTTTSPPTTTTTTTTIPTTGPPNVISAAGCSYVLGATNNFVNWVLYDDDPMLYMLYVDGSLNVSSPWYGSDISVNVDGHSVGSYNYTLVLLDYSANMVKSTVFVHVYIQSTSTTTTTTTSSTTSDTGDIGVGFLGTLTLAISLGSMMVIIIVVVAIVKSKS
ncbi:MAG: ABC transporter substrate-binding protein [Candidatus Thorarchaeota archaeon]